MARRAIKEIIIPRCEARALEVLKGQTFRVVEMEGKQVGDMTLLNLRDFREKFNAMVTNSANGRYFTRATKLYSGPPAFNVMLSVVDDKVGVHWIHGRCTRFMYQLLHGVVDHPNCQDNIAQALRPYGIGEYDVPFDTFNIFMKAELQTNGRYVFGAPLADKGDYIDFLAEMDVLVAISACPEELTAVNDYLPKSLKVEIF